jgi:ribosomal protein L6P/L9E
MGLKAIMHIRGLIFKLGYSHRVFYLYPNNIRIHYENKKYFKLESRSILNLKNAIWSITTLKKMNAYKKKGVYLRGGVYGVKISIKKAKV